MGDTDGDWLCDALSDALSSDSRPNMDVDGIDIGGGDGEPQPSEPRRRFEWRAPGCPKLILTHLLRPVQPTALGWASLR